MPRKKNDGRGKTGGRKAGTPNKDKPLKVFLREHSLDYFSPNLTADDFKSAEFYHTLRERFGDKPFSQYEIDLLAMKPSERVTAELSLLKFHTPQMQASSVDMTVQEQNSTFTDRLKRLAAGENIPSPAE